jgi:hypothetical protein
MDQTEIRINGANGTTEKMWKYNCQLKIWVLVHRKITFGAAIGYSSGKNSSSLKTPPARQICRRHYIRTNMIRFYKINMETTSFDINSERSLCFILSSCKNTFKVARDCKD